MNRLVPVLFLLAAAVNLVPASGVLSGAVMAKAYGIDAPTGDLLILMRHRALLFAIVGSLLLVAAFRPRLRITAGLCGLVSMLGFVALAGDHGSALRPIVVIDVVASALLALAMLFEHQRRRGHEPRSGESP